MVIEVVNGKRWKYAKWRRGQDHIYSVIASCDKFSLLKPYPEETIQCWREGSRLWGDAQSVVFQMVIFLSHLFSFFFNRQIMAEVI